MVQLMYKPVSLLASVLDGALARITFKRARRLAAGRDEAPKATAIRRGYRGALIVATVQGAICAVVGAALDKSAAQTTRQPTGPRARKAQCAGLAGKGHLTTVCLRGSRKGVGRRVGRLPRRLAQ